jgi:phosphate transport system protein
MTKQFHADLEKLKTRVLEMGAKARLNIVEGVRSVVERDAELADRVIARGMELNRMDVEIERDALDLLALNQPVAQDLRTVGASLKIITYLDRIGRYGYDLAKMTKQLPPREAGGKKPVTLNLMADHAMAMLDAALDAYRTRDGPKARNVGPQDEVVDALYEQMFRTTVTNMMEDPRTITRGAHLILAARHLERAADNASKIAEKVLYMATGERRLPV